MNSVARCLHFSLLRHSCKSPARIVTCHQMFQPPVLASLFFPPNFHKVCHTSKTEMALRQERLISN